MKNRLFLLIMVVFPLLACLLLLEYGLRYFYFKPWDETNIVGNPDHRMTRANHNNVNSDGIRSDLEADAFRAEDFNVLFLGDSFTYGWRVKKGKTLPAQFEKQAHAAGLTAVRSVNFGWVSSSPYLSERLLREKGARYKPDMVVLILDMTDIFDDQLYRNVVERRHIFSVGRYFPAITQLLSLTNRNLWQSSWLARHAFGLPVRQFFIVENPLEETRPYFDRTMANIDAINHYCQTELGVPFVLFIMPRHFQFDARLSPDNWEKGRYPLSGPYLQEPFRYFSEISQTKPYPVISLLDVFRTTQSFPVTFQDDPHLNEEGNAVAATAVLAGLVGRGALAK
jgi:hypothetical protein